MLPILYQDEALIAVDKPSGLLSVPGRGPDKQDCVIARLLIEFPEIRCIHRLDRDTSGIMLVARTAAAQRHISHQFETRQVKKRYEAIVFGQLQQQRGEIDYPLAKDFSAPPRHRVDHAHGRAARTAYQVIASETVPRTFSSDKQQTSGEGINRTRVALSPHTGRSHQLRVHLAALGHPILGDPLYSPPEVQAAASRLMLHALEITFAHPVHGEPIFLSSACPF